MSEQTNKEYLGDGVYVEYDGDMFRLSTIRHECDEDIEHYIYLEPSIVNAFLIYRTKKMEEQFHNSKDQSG